MKYLKIFSIVSYCLIMLMGQMIAIPFILWLGFTVFDFGNIDQLFAFLGLLGIILSFMKSKHPVLISLISFALMISAVTIRLIHVSIEALNYPAFKIPFFIFIATQILLVFLIINSKRKTNLIK
ncbi:hypothetical protein [Chryseobacterium scophthalmum]|uniref:hypothetical protein n=1 Tax=Chryseobacterium scophthalmum TaxID=59733 RepID=UPI001FD9D15F|nr:hypothetical protein [Chryseobacterium scophthalmum]